MPSPDKRGCKLLLICVAASLLIPTTSWSQTKMEIHSSAFVSGETIAPQYSCSGEDISPPLSWSGVSQNAKSLALIVDDLDAPGGIFVHWVVYNISPQTTHLEEAIPKSTSMPGGGAQGRNDFDHDGYGGPCPPPGRPHHYRFRIFALDQQISPESAMGPAVEKAMQGHILSSAELTGTFGR
jgi:Raf kinase inhibitor-like YbhB/YbcL family protein